MKLLTVKDDADHALCPHCHAIRRSNLIGMCEHTDTRTAPLPPLTLSARGRLKRYLVFAGTRTEFDHWRHANRVNSTDCIYVYDEHALCGRQPDDYVPVTYGTWYEKNQYLLDMARAYGFLPRVPLRGTQTGGVGVDG